ncbi:hypothetical protein SAMN04488503_1906 [Humidesulfovibrio mexicanus]|uniref:Uncharacterized protein n=1 Tax=Humidesulfovibrio mexicanus TaxID=147047 RepID=A0A239A916_9BACT|nr:hypothetical protein SAMN04488503_1906 [Humidesulfovibrio mexicanus]
MVQQPVLTESRTGRCGRGFGAACALLALLVVAAFAPAALASPADAAGIPPYPFGNRYKATVFGTPPDVRHKIPGADGLSPETRSIRISGRRVPELFWYCESVEYSVLAQKGEAPLVFVIAGTGGRFNSTKVRYLQQLFHQAGYHAVGLSSPTHFNSIVSLSRHGISGYVPFDVDDLYTLMGWVKQDVEKRLKVRGYAVAGYSLGGLHAAFLARKDARDKVFGFQKVLAINPAVDLYNSALVFDSWLKSEAPSAGGPEQAVTKFIDRFSEFYRTNHIGRLDSEVLYRFFDTLDASDEELKQIIAVGFRITASSMVFTSDVCLGAGYVTPRDRAIATSEPLLPYFQAASRVSFEQYFEEFLLPYLRHRDPAMTKEKALADCTLVGMARFLRESPNIYVVGNEDDPILNERELAYLKDTFGPRAFFFPRGGHCGNMQYAGFAQKLLEVMKP